MRSMLTYLEAVRYKITASLNELDSRPPVQHPLAAHIQIIRDKQGLQQSILKVSYIISIELLKIQLPFGSDIVCNFGLDAKRLYDAIRWMSKSRPELSLKLTRFVSLSCW